MKGGVVSWMIFTEATEFNTIPARTSNSRTGIPRGRLMDHTTQATIHQIIAKTLTELGLPDARFSISDTTILIRDGSYIGRSLVCGPVRVVIISGGERIEFYDQNDDILRLIYLNQSGVLRDEAA